MGKQVSNFLGHTVREILVVRIGAHVDEGQNGDRVCPGLDGFRLGALRYCHLRRRLDVVLKEEVADGKDQDADNEEVESSPC